jgi:hypothetical protein
VSVCRCCLSVSEVLGSTSWKDFYGGGRLGECSRLGNCLTLRYEERPLTTVPDDHSSIYRSQLGVDRTWHGSALLVVGRSCIIRQGILLFAKARDHVWLTCNYAAALFSNRGYLQCRPAFDQVIDPPAIPSYLPSTVVQMDVTWTRHVPHHPLSRKCYRNVCSMYSNGIVVGSGS